MLKYKLYLHVHNLTNIELHDILNLLQKKFVSEASCTRKTYILK
jgi:predicted GNAT family N-acyltransferase